MPPFGLGLGLVHPLVSVPVTPPPGYTLFLTADQGVTFASGVLSWVDQSSNAYLFHGGSGTSLTTLNGKAAVGFATGLSQGVVSTATLGNVITTTTYCIASVWYYSGAVTATSVSYDSPSIFDDTDQYAGVYTALNSTSPTELMAAAFAYPGTSHYAQTTGAPGSNAVPHYTVSTLTGSDLTQQTDGGTPVTTTGVGVISSLANAISVAGNDFLGSIRLVLVYNTIPDLTALNAYLHAAGGF
jgi:hypothetical protein